MTEGKYKLVMNDTAALKQFRNSGMLWLVNRILHPFGSAIAVAFDSETQEPIGLQLFTTTDPEGMEFTVEDNLEMRKRFNWEQKGSDEHI